MMFYPLPYRDPLGYIPSLRGAFLLFLDSCSQQTWVDETGRYSFIASHPLGVARCWGRTFFWNEKVIEESPWDWIKRHNPPIESEILFSGGWAGYWGYEMSSYLEQLPLPDHDEEVPDLLLGLFDLVIGFDHIKKTSWIVSTGLSGEDFSYSAQRAQKRLDGFLNLLEWYDPVPPKAMFLAPWISDAPQNNYEEQVRRVRNYIATGDIFQANLSRRLTTPRDQGIDLWDLYRYQRFQNPAPFSSFWESPEVTLISSSPERFLKINQDKHVETRPMKGTRKRDLGSFENDRRLEQELKSSEKDQAENLMIVDLMRNDLSKVCRPYSVQVPQLFGVETYARVHQMVSVVTGTLEAHLSAWDALRACFPGGSITGAPKIRAMEILKELEFFPRGPYCGALGYWGCGGDMDTSILIRTLCATPSEIRLQVGGGIVWDSIPRDEYEETETKSRGLRHERNVS